MNPHGRTRMLVTLVAAIAGALIAVLVAGCADFLAAPAAGGRIALSLQPRGPAGQTTLDSLFDAVDGLSVLVYSRDQAVLMADSFAVSPSGGIIRQVILVPLDEGDDVELYVRLNDGEETVFTGEQTVRLLRGELTTVEVELIPGAFPPDPGIGGDAGDGVAGSRLPGERPRAP